MQNKTIYMTTSWGGEDGRMLEESYFVCEEAARLNALNNTWNDSYKLYKVNIQITKTGKIRIGEKEFLGAIPCGRERIK